MAISSIEIVYNSTDNRFDVTVDSSDPGTATWYLGYTSPTGLSRPVDFTTPDLTGASGSFQVASLDVAFIDGEYSFDMRNRPDGTLSTEVSEPLVFSLISTGDMVIDVSRDTSNIYASDDTVYPTTNTLARVFRLVYPVVAGVPASPDYTTTEAELQRSMVLADGIIYGNVTWTVAGENAGTVDITGSKLYTFRHDRTYTGQVNYQVLASLDPCSIITCVDQTYQTLIDQACTLGGVHNLPDRQADQFAQLQGALNLYTHYVTCNNVERADYYYNELRRLTATDCIPDSKPIPIGNAAPDSGTWTAIPGTAYLNGYDAQPGDELSWRTFDNVMFFSGRFTATSFVETGLTMIAPTYWTDQGITFQDGQQLILVDTSTTSNGGVNGSVYTTIPGGFSIRATAAAAVGNIYALSGSLLLIT